LDELALKNEGKADKRTHKKPEGMDRVVGQVFGLNPNRFVLIFFFVLFYWAA